METTQQPDEEPEEPWLDTKACEGQESRAEKKEHTQQTVRDNLDTHTFIHTGYLTQSLVKLPNTGSFYAKTLMGLIIHIVRKVLCIPHPYFCDILAEN